jgi:hypothetical protein
MHAAPSGRLASPPRFRAAHRALRSRPSRLQSLTQDVTRTSRAGSGAPGDGRIPRLSVPHPVGAVLALRSPKRIGCFRHASMVSSAASKGRALTAPTDNRAAKRGEPQPRRTSAHQKSWPTKALPKSQSRLPRQSNSNHGARARHGAKSGSQSAARLAHDTAR